MTARSPLGIVCSECAPGRPCAWCLSTLVERRRETEPVAPPMAREKKPEPKQAPRTPMPGDDVWDREAAYRRWTRTV